MSPRLTKMTDRSEGLPTNRLGRIANAMNETADTHPEAEQADRAIVMLDNGENGLIATFGYDDDRDAFLNLLAHVDAIAQANGMRLDFIPVKSPGQG